MSDPIADAIASGYKTYISRYTANLDRCAHHLPNALVCLIARYSVLSPQQFHRMIVANVRWVDHPKAHIRLSEQFVIVGGRRDRIVPTSVSIGDSRWAYAVEFACVYGMIPVTDIPSMIKALAQTYTTAVSENLERTRL